MRHRRVRTPRPSLIFEKERTCKEENYAIAAESSPLRSFLRRSFPSFSGTSTGKGFGKEISSAEDEARRIINEAIKNSESKKREALLEAKEDILRSRTEYEKEEKSRRADLQKQERRLQQKEENLDRKTENIEKKEDALAQKHADADRTQEEIELIKRSQTEMLERISGFTVEEAKNYLHRPGGGGGHP